MPESLEKLAVWVLVALYILGGILSLPNCGLTWDESLGNIYFGDRYMHFFASLNPRVLDYDYDIQASHTPEFNLDLSPMIERPWEFPPVSDTLSAVSMHIFAYRLHWLNPVDAFHLFKVLLAGVFLGILYFFAAPHMGRMSAAAGTLFLATFPRYWADMRFNPKDIPETVFFALTLMAYLAWLKKPGWKRSLLAGLLFGAAIGTKANALFIPVVLALGLVALRGVLLLLHPATQQPPVSRLRGQLNRLAAHAGKRSGNYLLMVICAAGLYIASWPYLYIRNTPWNGIVRYFSYILRRGSSGSREFDWEPLFHALGSMPEWMLACLVLGLAFVVIRLIRSASDPRDWSASYFLPVLLCWFLLPLGRASLPGQLTLDGIRHFMEYTPAAALIAGMGAGAAANWLSRRVPRPLSRLAAALPLLLVAANAAWNYAAFSPYEHLYYNRLVGGYAGSLDRLGPEDVNDYWGCSYKPGMLWLSRSIPPGSALIVSVAPAIAEMSQPLFLRPDIRLVKSLDEAPPEAPGVYLMTILRPDYYGDASRSLAEACAARPDPEFQIRLDGRPILRICRVDVH